MSMTKIRTLVVDDEPIARLAIVRLLSEDCGMELVGECGDGASALNAIRELAPDLVFLDIKMPALSGIDVATQIGHKRGPVMVFVTAYERYAVRAFEANAVDYLVKPFSRERFFVTLARVKRRLASTDAALEEAASQQVLRALSELRREQDYLERIPVPVDEHLVFVEVRVEKKMRVQLHLQQLQTGLRETMTVLEARLNPRHFARVHRSAIVNVSRVAAIHPWFNGHHVLVLSTGQQLRMSRYQQEAFLRLTGRRGQ
ncbi:MAG: response regulator transcription factor [Gammaproteobacteria bacterium]|nr:MAG: response regulator transcription factor [Gammaproteobacteria bacterium]